MRRVPAAIVTRAVLLLLTRLGLRAGEVAALTVKDIDWHNGSVCVAGKGGRQRRLPPSVDTQNRPLVDG